MWKSTVHSKDWELPRYIVETNAVVRTCGGFKMKIGPIATLLLVAICGSETARANERVDSQAYCLSKEGAEDCEYATLKQCMEAASGQSGTCEVSPLSVWAHSTRLSRAMIEYDLISMNVAARRRFSR